LSAISHLNFDHFFLDADHHPRAYESMGAHLTNIGNQAGIHFAVWAPQARQVNVVGDFNQWQGDGYAMSVNQHGIWTLFIPGLPEHTLYKYQIVTANGQVLFKADPFGFAMEQRPNTGSVVVNLHRHQWHDDDWLHRRADWQPPNQPLSVYELHPGSWQRVPDPDWGRRYLCYRELADQLIPYVLDMGFTHIELMPIAEHPLDASWGYQVLGYFAVTSRFGDPDDLMYFVDQCHQHNLGVILDWVPAHYPKDEAGLYHFDGTHLYSHSDPRHGENTDWGTMAFDYQRAEVRAFLLSNALFWLDKYHFDGLRVDAVASMLRRNDGEPNQAGLDFIRQMNETVHDHFPGVLTIAEESSAWPHVTRPAYMDGLGFDLKWNMGWMHDSLAYLKKSPVERQQHHHAMTFSLVYAFDENFILSLSHDEVTAEKGSLLSQMHGDDWHKLAGLRAYYGFMWGHPGKKLLFMGDEFAHPAAWDFDRGLDWEALQSPAQQGVQRLVRDLNQLCQQGSALYEQDFSRNGFSWLNADDSTNSVFAFIRRGHNPDDFIVVISNFGPGHHQAYRLGVPQAGRYHEVFNSDAAAYGGSNIGNASLDSEPLGMHGQPQSVALTLPPLTTLMLKITPR